MRAGVDEDILRFYVTVADALGVDVRNRAQELVGVELDQEVRDHLLHLQVLLHHAVGRIRNVVHHHVQIHFVWLVTVRVERLPHLDAVGVVQHLEDLQLSVFVSLILEDLFDRNRFASLCYDCLEDHSERTISDNFLRVVSKTLLNKNKVRRM